MIASTITDGPAILAQLILRSPMPRAAACFSISWRFSIAMSGMKMAPNCCANVISLISWARACGVDALAIAKASDKHTKMRLMDPNLSRIGCGVIPLVGWVERQR
jgi:hypothetical protein